MPLALAFGKVKEVPPEADPGKAVDDDEEGASGLPVGSAAAAFFLALVATILAVAWDFLNVLLASFWLLFLS